MANLAKYIVQLEAQTAKYVQELDKANRKLDRFHKDQERAVGKIKDAFLSVGKAFAAAFTVQAITRFTAEAIRVADAIGESARQAGFGAERFQRLQFVFKQSGVEAREFELAMRQLNTRLGQFLANGTGPLAKALDTVGLKQRVLSGEIRTSEQLFDALTLALGGIANEAQRAGIASRFFSEEIGPKLAVQMAKGTEALKQAEEQATGVFSDETIRKADRLGDAWDRISAAAGSYVKSLTIAAAHDIGQAVGIDELQPQNAEERVEQLLKLRESLIAANLTLDAAEAKELADLQEQIANRNRFRTGGTIEDSIREMNEAAFKEATRGLQRIGDVYEKFPDLKLKRPNIELDLLPEDQLEEIVVNAKPISLDDLIKPFPTAEVEKLFEPLKREGQIAAETIGENFRDAFADWIIGADRNFKDLLKRMAADMVASGIFQAFASAFSSSTSGIGKFFGAFFGGARAGGGPVSAGRAYLVGERGPELFMPNTSGMISAGGGTTINMGDTHIDARGADSSLIQRLPKILDDHRQRTKAEIADLIRRNRFATS